MAKYSDTLDNLQHAIDQLKSQGITVEPLNNSVEELRRHSENIEKVENSIDAIQEEVISPIRTELAENKEAGKYSRYGFWVGGAGLVASVVALYVTNDVALDERLAAIETHLEVPVTEELGDTDGSTIIAQYALVTELVNIRGQSFSVKVQDFESNRSHSGLVAGIGIMLDGREIGPDKVAEYVEVIHRHDTEEFYDRTPFGPVHVAEGDSLVVMDAFEYRVDKVLHSDPLGRDFGDEVSAVWFSLAARNPDNPLTQ